MKRQLLAGAVMLVLLGACGRDQSSPPPPSPGTPPKPKTEFTAVHDLHHDAGGPLAQTGAQADGREWGVELLRAPGALPAAERHFEVFQRLYAERAILIQAGLRDTDGLQEN